MSEIDAVLVVYAGTLFLNCGAAGAFFFVIPKDVTGPRRVSVRYFFGYFILSALGYISFLTRELLDLYLSVFLTNVFFLSAAYSVLFGISWRYNKPVYLLKHPALIHIFGLALVQLAFVAYWSNSIVIRLFLAYMNVTLVYLYTLWQFNHLEHQDGEKDNLMQLGIATAIFAFIAMPLTYFSSQDRLVYYAVILAIQSLITIVLFGAFFSTFLFDAIRLYRKHALTDPLTGLYNRRYFFEQAGVYMRAAQRHEFPISVMLCDLDHFKNINDRFGHSVGDQALQAFAKCLKTTTRNFDLVARIGGEEFAAILPQTTTDEAVILANRLRENVSEIAIDTELGTVRFTASFGITSMDENTELEVSMKAADKALYSAKEGGRNRVIATP